MWLDGRMKNVAFLGGIWSDQMVKNNSIMSTWYIYFWHLNKAIWIKTIFFFTMLCPKGKDGMAESHLMSCFYGELLVLIANVDLTMFPDVDSLPELFLGV